MASSTEAGVEALRRLQARDPVSWLARDPTLPQTARVASQYLFSFLRPFSKKSPLDQLLVDGFDVEQIWQQIDLQSQPLLFTLRRRVNHLEKNPEEISKLKEALQGKKKVDVKSKEEWNEESDGFDEELDEGDEDDEEEGVEEDEKEGEKRGETETEDEKDGEDEEDGIESEEGKSEEENEEADGGGIEDKFLKIKDLAKYLQEEEDNLENDQAGQLKDDEEEREGDDESDEVRLFFAYFVFNFLSFCLARLCLVWGSGSI